ncbi:deacetylase Oant_2987-like [Ylistrum balloti]|uniref:deacetylase Oant_2987-like n=1 Tax=Ylistrum balloti TaxID=509963 RepID=UPI002905DD84|nr:deacetylase Oant_2987-like [Ylistrum balloti]XP_060078127.1 deacetylase Oant_2987-like [Ylistrum balloti]XP_060078137.1 deacetylase Oant_2987-like [Ylistrum balloti]XP_060078145.1 deacetylase Oant_2987-like [Ylistrum balloti]
MMCVDYIIRGGRVIDPKNEIDIIGDVAIHHGLVHSVGKGLQITGKEEFNAEGCLITPGLIDGHVHCYQWATPLGINPDERCLSRGVTTVVDAGSSGYSTFPGLRKFIAERSETRVLCFLHIAAHGLAAAGCSAGAPGGESDCLNQLDVTSCRDVVEQNRDMIVGVKARLSESITNQGKNEQEVFKRAMEVGRLCKVPVMCHHTLSTIPTQGRTVDDCLCCPRDMSPGDIYTHTYHAFTSTIIDPETGNILDDVIEARKKGVLFEVGHGQGSFSWTVAEMCAKRSFWPDIIGTDLHSGNQDGPVYDLPRVMTKLLHLGMPLCDVISAVTINTARAIGREGDIGSLSTGLEADVTVLKLETIDMDLEDSQSQTRRVHQWFSPVAVWRKGQRHAITKPAEIPNMAAMKMNVKDWPALVIKDSKPPSVLQDQ